ncbi:MAG: wax ester/triacylglycerol synthase domain-containing protein [Actinomycetota bacterium]
MQRLMGSDAGMLYQEQLPHQPLHTVKVLVVDPGPGTTPASLAAVVAERARHVEPLRWQPVDVPAHLFHPVWRSVDPVPEHHVEVVELGSPDQRGLEAEVSRLASDPLERDRPLWHATIAHGLADDRLAVILRLHHAIADGGSSVRILTQLADSDAEPDRRTAPAEEPPGRATLAADAARDLGRAVAGLPGLAARTGRAISTGRVHSQAAAVDPVRGRL